MLKLKRLKVHKCRSVQPGTELEFNDRLNVILGRNGAGKTTLLKLVAAAVGSSFAEEFHEDTIHIEYEYELHGLRIRCEFRHDGAYENEDLTSSRVQSPVFQARFSSPHDPPVAAEIRGNSITIICDGRQREFRVNATVMLIPGIDLVALIGTYLADNADAPTATQTVFSRFESKLTRRQDEALDWLRHTLDNLGIIFTEIDNDERWCMTNVPHSGLAYDFRSALAEYRHIFSDLPEVLTIHSERVPFLAQACAQIGLRDASWTFSFSEQVRRKENVKLYRDSKVFVTTHGGTRFPLEKLSFGQLRLFAFFLHSAMHPHVIVADELTNGLHHEMVDCCLDTIGERQAFLATQNPLLLDHIGFGDADEVRRTFIICDLQAQADGEKIMCWRNMSAKEAYEFYADYKVGIQHVNAILRKRGLW